MATIETGIRALSGYDVPSSQATAYTVVSGILRFRVDQASVVNYTVNDARFTLYVLQNGDTVIDRNKRFDKILIPANTNYPLDEIIGEVLNTGGIINAFSDTANALALTINGTTFK